MLVFDEQERQQDRMEKRKRDPVVPEMRERLRANRDGRLAPAQWIDMIIQPLIPLLLLLAPALLVFGVRFIALARFLPLLILLVVLMFAVPAVLRARRYARAPVHFARLYAGIGQNAWWAFWKPTVFYTAADEPFPFKRRLAPSLPLRIDREYLVYYLEEPDGRVLLSAAPVDHDDADSWMPTETFDRRFNQRTK